MPTFDSQLVAESGGKQFNSDGSVVRSSKGAIGIAQVMPATGPEAARLAGLPWDLNKLETDPVYNQALGKAYKDHMLSVFGGDDRKATAAYNAGPGRIRSAVTRGGANWEQHIPAETTGYLAKVFGGSAAVPAPADTPALAPVHMPTIDEMIHSTPDLTFAGDERAIHDAKVNRAPKQPSVADMMRTALTGGDGVIQTAPLDMTAAHTDYAQTAADVAAETHRQTLGFGDRFKAGFEGTLTARVVEAIGAKHQEFDPAWIAQAKGNWQQIHAFAQNDGESAMLDEATSAEHLKAIQGRIEDERQRNLVLNSSGHGMAFALTTGILDPVGIAAGALTGGVGKAAGLAEAALAAGRAGKVAYTMGENMVGNLAVTAGLDATGEYVTPGDYAMSALTGLAIGLPMSLIKSNGAYARPTTRAQMLSEASPLTLAGDGHIEAFQGSSMSTPIDKHQWEFLGTGEGNHAQGKGHYFAENQAIGAWYWDQLTLTKDVGGISANEGADAATSDLLKGIQVNPANFVGLPPEVAITEARGIFKQAAVTAKDKVVGWLRSVADTAMSAVYNPKGEAGRSVGTLQYRAAVSTNLANELEHVVRAEKGGSVYKVNLKQGDYLDFDKPLAEQSPAIQAKVRKAGFTGEDTATGEMAYRAISPDMEVASASLRRAGILGNKYLNAMARSGKVEAKGNYNFVAFSDENISISHHWTPEGDWVARDNPKVWGPTTVAPAANPASLEGQIAEGRAAEKRFADQTRAEVTADLGEHATPEAIQAEVGERYKKAYQEQVQYTLADIPAAQKLMVGHDLLTDNPETLAALEAKHDMGSISDPTERGLVVEQMARSEAVVKANPIDIKHLNTILEKVGLESTAMRLLKSDSDVAKAVGITLLENPTGAGGRSRSAAIATAQRSRIYNEHFSQWDGLQDTFRKQEGITAMRDFWDGKARNRFNERVRDEVESRGTATHVPDENIQVQKAADIWESGMDMMRKDQQHVGTVGSERLGAHSIGYAPHRLDPRKVLAMSADKQAMSRVREILSSQFQEHEGFDAKFSDKLGAKYLERAILAAKGSYAVPFNLHSPEAGQMVREALEAMNVHGDELEGMMMKFTRGGAGHTKARLKLDLSADIGDGKKLGDLFIKDMPQLYRAYSRRVAGEVSLAQYGVMGKKGLDVLRRAIDVSGGSPKDLEAFDQIAAEFLNTPYGTHNHKWMDNLRVATSAARLGGMAFTQFAEWGNAIPSVGVQGMTNGIASMPRIIAEVSAISKGKGVPNPILQSIDTLGGYNGLEDYHLTRAFDVRDNDIPVYGSEAMGLGSRMLQTASHKVMIMTGHRMILASQVRSMSEQIVRKAVTYAKSGAADTALDDMGIHAGLRDALKADLDKIATFDAKGNLESLDLFKGEALKPHMVNELVQAVERGAGQIIQRTYIGETGKWAHNGLLKLLLQFRTFSLIAVEKQWGRNLQNYGALKSFMHLAGTASFALPIYLARLQVNMASKDEAAAKEYWEKHSTPVAMTRAVLNYASASGMAGDITDVMAGFASNYGGDFGERFGKDYDVRGKRTDQLIGGLIAPGLGLAQDAWGGIMHGDLQKLARSAPGGNLPYVTPFVNAMPRGLSAQSQGN